jgi:hypothetical protein
MSKPKKERASVSLQQFIKTTIVERDTYTTAQEAAKQLGMTLASFKQRLQKERKDYPSVYEGFQPYQERRRKATEAEALDILQSLLQEKGE